jgi:hypothetical protein
MSSGDDYAWSIDPTRVRNMTQFSSAFGSSHLVCDAAVYGAGIEMNNLQMQSKWSANARADPAVPIPPDVASEASMSTVGTMSGDVWDTPHVPAAGSDAMFRHSVGIVRDWLRYYGDADEAREMQAALDARWPHWADSIDTYGAQPPIELLRQQLEQGGFYDREKLAWREVEDVVMVAEKTARWSDADELRLC